MVRDGTARTRDLFLFSIGAIYMFAFGSIYTQIPGLFGAKGIMPVQGLMKAAKEEQKNAKSTEDLFLATPTLLWFLPFDYDIGMEFLAILGTFISFLTLISQSLRIGPVYFLLWLLYLSIYKVGETFMWFQWDILLLEVGVLCMFVAPLTNTKSTTQNSHRQIPFWLVRWLLFRLMFASGIVKLTSNCPTWWGLTALNYHYETQCIPTPLAWWAHQLPTAIQQFSVLGTYFIEILLPFLFFIPLRFCRLLACYGQVFLMFVISLTGNYNFFNLLTTALCLSLMDDQHLAFLSRCFCCRWGKGNKARATNVKDSKSCKPVVLNLAVLATLGYICYQLTSYKDQFELEFTSDQLNEFLKRAMPVITWIATILFVSKILLEILRSVKEDKCGNLCRILVVVIPSVFLFSISLVPFGQLSADFRGDLWPIVQRWHDSTDRFELVNSYGLFRRMTGVGGRPEIVIEGSQTVDGPWKEYEFVYKPGKTTSSPPWTVPHQPRLDWQMWFAALGSYQYSTWYISLVHRLLIGQPEVLDLLDRERLPFTKAPKYIRSKLYFYHFTKVKKNGTVPKSWWKRKFQKEYSPRLTAHDPSVLDFMKYNRLMPAARKIREPNFVERFLNGLRPIVKMIHPPTLLWGIFLTALAISALLSLLSSWTSQKKEKVE